MQKLSEIRQKIRAAHLGDEKSLLADLRNQADLNADVRAKIENRAIKLIEDLRADDRPGLMEVFLAEYGLSTDEGVALMCLAEALLRVPDNETIDDLIEDKIAPSSWGQHLGKSSSSLVNASTWALMLTGKVLDDQESAGVNRVLHGAVKRLGEPVIRTAVKRAMKEMGNQFVLGETIDKAIKRGIGMEEKGFTYSYDMLGEAALTEADADEFFKSYWRAIERLAQRAKSKDIRENPGISIKLSALHPRYEVSQKQRVLRELTSRTKALCVLAKKSNMGLNIDAEEADRLDLSLDIIDTVLRDEDLAGWDGFGVVVQAYGKRAPFVLDWLYQLAKNIDRKIMVRLVKGAYWDTEIKLAQIQGLKDFPVFTRKAATDVSYMCCAKKLLTMTDRIYPQFATHNAHSIATILEIALKDAQYEFQRLHGMGEVLHKQVLAKHGTHCRIYAPVGAHRDLLAYLVRRLLENGANSSFVNQIVDENVPAVEIAEDPFKVMDESQPVSIKSPADLFAPERKNSIGWDLHNEDDLADIDAARTPFKTTTWTAKPLIAGKSVGEAPQTIFNPANPQEVVGHVIEATPEDVDIALLKASSWEDATVQTRADILNKAADLYEKNFGEFFAVLTREAGKTPADAISELREAVDFLRYYAARGADLYDSQPRGLIICISPWNFPLAIFTGQIAAALAAGNGVLAKPADPTPIIATLAVQLLHKAGVPKKSLQLLPGAGSVVGAKLSSDPRINGLCFTGSTWTAQTINRAMAKSCAPDAPLIAETGGLNAMVVDSTALPEQAVRDILISAFQSAGQRCSALRVLYLQEDIAKPFQKMLFGAMDELCVGDPWGYSTDLGPVINKSAQADIDAHIQKAKQDGRLLKQLTVEKDGNFIGPAVIAVGDINDLEKEIFGPVLHIATFKAENINDVINDINNSGFGLTFGLHTRIDDRVEHFTNNLNVGNMYINRNQIGAIVGSQPFGGEGLSGTGPKAGGPHYVKRFTKDEIKRFRSQRGEFVDIRTVQAALDKLQTPLRHRLDARDLPGPTGESNRLSTFPKGTVLCLGPTLDQAQEQAQIAQNSGCPTLIVAPGAQGDHVVSGRLKPEDLVKLNRFSAVVLWSDESELRVARQALAARDGELIPLIANQGFAEQCVLERHVCIDTTAAGGNASLLAANS
ncbi:MAG: bifunctional proline dehydrogenase/L-glutamate gamma-semialdehyde dehydrogenase PutA [Acidimicrobiales bacterium]|nr:MAG: bifunctional proline dehydrogenase/L-glutamate gamma-semialdehyde dehydrogenase PutA [Acidimicrobiales bacterium]